MLIEQTETLHIKKISTLNYIVNLPNNKDSKIHLFQ